MDNKYLEILDQRDEERKRQMEQQRSNSTMSSSNPAAGNKYMQILDERDAARDQAFRYSARNNIDANPDKAAEERRQAQFLNAPEAYVRDNPEDAARAAKLKTLNDNTQNAPVLRQKYTDQDFARIAHDDSGVLSSIEKWASGAGSFAWAKARAGWFNLTGTATVLTGDVLGALSQDEAAILFKDKPQEYKQWQESSAGFFARASRHLFEQADRAGKDINEQAKQAYGDKRYFTADSDKSALLSPVKIVGDAVESLPTTLALMATALLTKNASVAARTTALEAGLSEEAALIAQRQAAIKMAQRSGATTEGVVSYGQTRGTVELETSKADMSQSPRYAELLKQGYTPEMARDIVAGEVAEQSAQIAGVVDAATNLVAGQFLAKIFGESGPLLKRSASGFATEGATEFVQSAGEQFGQNWAEKAILNPDTSLSKNVLESAFSGLFVGGLTGGGFAAVLGSNSEHEKNVRGAEETKKFMDGILKSAEESKTLARAPEVFQSFLESTTDGTPAQDLYISAQTLMQSGIDEQVRELLPSVNDQFFDALMSNGFIRIPTAEYVTAMAGNKLNEQLIDNIKLDPNGYTFAESQEYQKTFNQEMSTKLEQMMSEKEGDDKFKASRDAVREQFLQELNTANRFTSEANQAYASMLSSFYAVQAARANMTTEEFVQKYQLEVVNRAVQSERLFDQNGEPTPEFKSWFGESKVVGGDGKPMRVYHATRNGNITQFEPGRAGAMYFTPDTKYAESYGDFMMPVYLKIDNMADLTDKNSDAYKLAVKTFNDAGGWASNEDTWDYMQEEGRTNPNFDPATDLTWEIFDLPEAGVDQVLREAGYDGIKLEERRGVDSYAVFNPEQIKSVFNERPTNAPGILDQSAKQKPGPDAPGVGVEDGNKLGFWPALRVKMTAKLKLPEKPPILTGTTNKNAAKQIEQIDAILAKFPKATESVAEWTKMMAYALGSTEVPVPPYAFIRDLNGSGSLDKLRTLTQGQIDDATHGFENAAEFRRAYTSGELGVETTGKLFMWSFLSRGVSPYTQEALFIDAFEGADEWIAKAARGELTKDDFPAYEAWAKSVAPKGSGQPGAGATHNLNAFGQDFLFKMGSKGPDGKSHLQRLHDMMSDPNQTGKQIRREFATFGEGVGIDNKVVSFTLLVAGFDDVMVLDRVQIRQLWDDGRFNGVNLYDGVTETKAVTDKDGVTKNKPVKIAGSSLNNLAEGVRGILVYEAIERGLEAKIKQIYTELGRPEDASIGRYHWETWVADSQQEASHGTLGAILSDAKGNDQAIAQVAAKQGEYGAYEYGALYNRDESGTPWFGYQTPTGGNFEFSVPAFRAFLEDIKKASNGVVPSKFKVTESGNGPWYNRPEVNQQKLNERAAYWADRKGGSGEGQRALEQALQDQAAADRAGTGSGSAAGSLNQGQLDQPARGQISFADDITRQPSVISLLKDADLSTFIHEGGHFFLQVQADLASRIEGRIAGGEQVSQGEREIVADMNIVLDWFGITGTPQVSAIDTWASMSLEEQRPYHEKWARGFEAYAFEGKAPTLELQSVFQKFSSWLKRVYSDMKALNVELTDEVRGVMDRMLATTEQIQATEAARNMGPLFNAQNAQGIIEDWKAYHDLGLAATQEGIDILQARGLTDMKWLGNAQSRKLKQIQKEVKALRTQTMIDARREIMSQPIYRAWQFLTGKIEKDDKITPEGPRKSDPDSVDPQIDSLFTAIAKLGGISKAQVVSNWGWDPKERSPVPVFGKPTVRTEGGLSIDSMGELLAQYGYLELDENGKFDTAQFEELFDSEARGNTQYSNQVDPSIFVDPMPGASLILSNMKAARFDLVSLQSLGLDDAIVERIKDLKMTARDGIHPDIVAAEFEFSSGVELAQKLAASPKPSEAIEALTDQMMLQRYGDLATPEGIQRAADQAVHNEARLKFLHTEAKALETAMRVREDTGRTNAKGQKQTYAVLPQAAREFAASIIAKLRVRDLRPAQYTAAEVKAAKEAERAFMKGDLEKAAEEKRNQIINAYTAKEAMAAAGEIQQMVAYFRKFDKRSKGLDPDYYDQIVQMLERFDFVPSTSLKEIDARTSLSKWLDAQREQGIEPDIPPKLELEAYRTSYKNLTIEDMRGLRDAIKQIEHLGRLKMKLLNAADARAFAEIRQQMVNSIDENAGDRFVSNRQPATLLGEKWLSIKNFFAEHIKAATFLYVLDGGKNGGPMWENLVRPANLAGDKETVMRAQATRDLTDLIAPVLKEGKLTQKVFIEGLANAEDRELGKTGSTWTREQLLTMALNMGNASNMQRLLDGEGWTLEQLKLGLDQLTTADWTFAQQVWDYFESYRPEIGAKERRIYGKEPNWIEPQALTVETADGQVLTLRGGYYPVKYDTRASLRAEQDMSAEEAKRAMQSSYIASTTRRSFTKERAEVVKDRPLLYTLDGIYQGVNEVIHDLAWHEWVIDANKILKDPAISSAIRKHYGDYMHKQLTKWVDDNANGDQGSKGAGEKAAAFVRQSVSVAGLGLNFISALTQPFGITQSIVRVGSKYVGRGVARMAKNPMELNREINQMSDFMRTRSMTRMRELAELRNRVKNKSRTKENLDATMYLMMLGAQRLVDLPTWWGAYEKAIAEGNDQERAVDLADQSVIDAQGSGMTKDLAAIERGGPIQKLFTVFYSFMNTALNLGYAKTMTEKSKAKLTMDYLMLYVVPVILIAAMKDALTPGDSGDWDDWESIMNKLLKEELSFLMGMFVGVREVAPAYDAFMGKPGGDYRGPAGLRAVNDLVKLSKEAGQGELDDGLRKAVINMAGDIFGLPSAQLNRSITGAEALSDGDTSNPAALLFGYQQER